MGSGASSNPLRSTVNTGLAAGRWRSNVHSTRSSNSSAKVPQENDTDTLASDGNLDGIKVEGRYGIGIPLVVIRSSQLICSTWESK